MGDRFTKDDLYAKVEWEGGIMESITGYGIRHTSLPEDTPAEVVEAWQEIEAVETAEQTIADWLFAED